MRLFYICPFLFDNQSKDIVSIAIRDIVYTLMRYVPYVSHESARHSYVYYILIYLIL